MRKHIILGLAVVTALLTLWSCGSSRKATAETYVPSSVEQRYDRMIGSYSEWNTMSVPVKVQLNAPMKLSLSGKAYMERGKAIHVSLRVLGLEVAVLHVTPDSVYCIDKFHKLAVAEGLAKVSKASGVSFDDMQSMMIGRISMPGNGNRKGLKFGESVDGCEWSVSVDSGSGEWMFSVDSSTDCLESVTLKTNTGKSVSCEFAGWRESDLGLFPETLRTVFALSGKSVDATLKYTPSGVRSDRNDMPSFSMPSGYRVISASDLIKTLKSL